MKHINCNTQATILPTADVRLKVEATILPVDKANEINTQATILPVAVVNNANGVTIPPMSEADKKIKGARELSMDFNEWLNYFKGSSEQNQL